MRQGSQRRRPGSGCTHRCRRPRSRLGLGQCRAAEPVEQDSELTRDACTSSLQAGSQHPNQRRRQQPHLVGPRARQAPALVPVVATGGGGQAEREAKPLGCAGFAFFNLLLKRSRTEVSKYHTTIAMEPPRALPAALPEGTYPSPPPPAAGWASARLAAAAGGSAPSGVATAAPRHGLRLRLLPRRRRPAAAVRPSPQLPPSPLFRTIFRESSGRVGPIALFPLSVNHSWRFLGCQVNPALLRTPAQAEGRRRRQCWTCCFYFCCDCPCCCDSIMLMLAWGMAGRGMPC